MAYLTNTWVGYLDRTAAQIMQLCLTKLGTKVPEMTDHSPSNPYVRNLEQFSAIYELLSYYVDNAARESFVTEARLYASLINKAREFDYQVIGNVPYAVDVQFSISAVSASAITVAAGDTVSNSDGTKAYRILTNAVIPIGQTVSNVVGAIQSERVTGVAKGTSLGNPNMEFVFTERITHNTISARWNSVAWQRKETLAYSSPIDKDFVQTVDKDGNVLIYFGNENPFGDIPPSGHVLEVDYEVTLGADGKVEKGELNKVVSTTAVVPPGIELSVINAEASSDGSSVESIDDLKRHLPLSNRVLRRAVNIDDFEIITEQTPGVARAGAVYNGKRTIDIYIVPVGGGIAATPLISAAQAYINARKVVATNPIIRAAGEVHVEIVAALTILPSYSRVATTNAVKDALVSFMSYVTQRIKGKIYLSDLYQVIENVPGVDNSSISWFGVSPYARAITPTSPPLIWSKTLVANTYPTQLWQIVFTNSTTYKLVLNSTVFGTYTTGTLVSTPVLQFTIPAGAYSSGNTYQFYTYPFNATSVTLMEPSLPVSTPSDITLNSTGGY